MYVDNPDESSIDTSKSIDTSDFGTVKTGLGSMDDSGDSGFFSSKSYYPQNIYLKRSGSTDSLSTIGSQPPEEKYDDSHNKFDTANSYESGKSVSTIGTVDSVSTIGTVGPRQEDIPCCGAISFCLMVISNFIYYQTLGIGIVVVDVNTQKMVHIMSDRVVKAIVLHIFSVTEFIDAYRRGVLPDINALIQDLIAKRPPGKDYIKDFLINPNNIEKCIIYYKFLIFLLISTNTYQSLRSTSEGPFVELWCDTTCKPNWSFIHDYDLLGIYLALNCKSFKILCQHIGITSPILHMLGIENELNSYFNSLIQIKQSLEENDILLPFAYKVEPDGKISIKFGKMIDGNYLNIDGYIIDIRGIDEISKILHSYRLCYQIFGHVRAIKELDYYLPDSVHALVQCGKRTRNSWGPQDPILKINPAKTVKKVQSFNILGKGDYCTVFGGMGGIPFNGFVRLMVKDYFIMQVEEILTVIPSLTDEISFELMKLRVDKEIIEQEMDKLELNPTKNKTKLKQLKQNIKTLNSNILKKEAEEAEHLAEEEKESEEEAEVKRRRKKEAEEEAEAEEEEAEVKRRRKKGGSKKRRTKKRRTKKRKIIKNTKKNKMNIKTIKRRKRRTIKRRN